MTDDPASRDPRRPRRADERRPDERLERRPDERLERRPDERLERRPDERLERRPDERHPAERSPDAPRAGIRRPADPRRAVLAVVVVVIVLGLLVFWVQNHGRVSISYLTVQLTAPLWLMVTFSFVVGILIGVLLTLYYQRRQP